MNLRHQRESPQFDALAKIIYLKSRGDQVDFCPSPGNWGDALINLGSTQFMDAFAIPHREVTRQDVLQDKITEKSRLLVVGGGGGWCSMWNSTAPFVAEASALYHHVVVLPSTYETEQTARVSNCRNVTLVSRDSHVPQGSADNFSCHDMAFYIDFSEEFNPSLGPSRFSRINAFRHDKESNLTEDQYPSNNYDLSLLGNAFDTPEAMFSILSRFANISTDRLHIGIASCLLGVNTRLYPSKSKKIPEVHAHSIQSKHPNCHLMSHCDL